MSSSNHDDGELDWKSEAQAAREARMANEGVPSGGAAPHIDSDESTRLKELRDLVEQFVGERSWHRFHSPKNIAMALAVEAAELMEHFQWLTIDESRQLDAAERQAVGEEMADVLAYLLALANTLELDLSQAFRDKMVKNRAKYPA